MSCSIKLIFRLSNLPLNSVSKATDAGAANIDYRYSISGFNIPVVRGFKSCNCGRRFADQRQYNPLGTPKTGIQIIASLGLLPPPGVRQSSVSIARRSKPARLRTPLLCIGGLLFVIFPISCILRPFRSQHGITKKVTRVRFFTMTNTKYQHHQHHYHHHVFDLVVDPEVTLETPVGTSKCKQRLILQDTAEKNSK